MARLSSDKQERFANYLFGGYTQIAAYKEAGYTCKNTTGAANASKLANSPEIKARLEELAMKKAEKEALSTAPPLPLRKESGHGTIDLDWINREYISLLNKAKEIDDLKNAVSIVKEMAELNKVRPEPATDNNNNKMLPQNDKLPYMGPQVAISVFNQESSVHGRSSDGFVEISIPDAEFVPISNSDADEDQ